MKETITPEPFDPTDRRILAALQRDASLSNQALSVLAHVSPATCLRRVRRLLDSGVIERQVALVDPARVGRPLQTISEVTLDRQGAEHLDAFEARAAAHASVMQCYRVSPGPDFVLIALASDMDDWARVVSELFTQDANVRNVKTFFSVRRAKFTTAFPIG